MSIEERVRGLEAREAIRELQSQYAWFAMRAEAGDLARLFTVDGIFELLFEGGRRTIQGRAEIEAHMRRNLFPGKVAPLIHNQIVDVSNDEAAASCIMQSPATAFYPEGVLALYRDRARWDGEKWRFAERRAVRCGSA